jgi:hypothetical protein
MTGSVELRFAGTQTHQVERRINRPVELSSSGSNKSWCLQGRLRPVNSVREMRLRLQATSGQRIKERDRQASQNRVLLRRALRLAQRAQ